jgi:hypothetical protein
MDYKTGQLGIQASASGAVLTEGSWYCQAMPEPLVTATTDLRSHTIDPDLYQTRIAARAPYQLKRKDGPDADGYERLTCPALGSHPGLACPLRPGSLSPRDPSLSDLRETPGTYEISVAKQGETGPLRQ